MRSKKKNRLSFEEQNVLLAKQQVILSKERTILSFIRTGLAFIGVGVVLLNVFSTHSAQIIGWALILIGFVEVAESYRRLVLHQKKMDEIKKYLGEKDSI